MRGLCFTNVRGADCTLIAKGEGILVTQQIKFCLLHGLALTVLERELNQLLKVGLTLFELSGAFWIGPRGPLGEDLAQAFEHRKMKLLHGHVFLDPQEPW